MRVGASSDSATSVSMFAALPGVTVIPPGEVTPSGGGDPFAVFTPVLEPLAGSAATAPCSSHPPRSRLREDSTRAAARPRRGQRRRSSRRGFPWAVSRPGALGSTRGSRPGSGTYASGRDDLADDSTSRLSPYLRFGCLSPLEVAERAGGVPAARRSSASSAGATSTTNSSRAGRNSRTQDMRPRGDRWRDDETALTAWKDGRTGYPLVDAGMRQLREEGFMHNRARLVTASFLTKHLYLDWRAGAAHFADLLVDGDIPNNCGNWQWVAGTGADTRPNRMFNPTRQAQRYDPNGDIRPPVDSRARRASRAPRLTSRGSSACSRRRLSARRSSITTKPSPASARLADSRRAELFSHCVVERRQLDRDELRIRSSSTTVGLRRPSISGRATAAFTGVTRWSHHDERRGVSTGTSTMRGACPRIAAMRSIMDR